MLADPAIDVVHITTPNYLHYPQVKAALLAGKHVICEKPLAMDSHEGGELVALAKQKGLVNAINFNLRFYPLSHQAHAMLKSGQLGEVYIVQGSYLQDWLLLADRLELAAGARSGRRYARRGGYRLTLARPGDFHHQSGCGSGVRRFSHLHPCAQETQPGDRIPSAASSRQPWNTWSSPFTPKTTPR